MPCHVRKSFNQGTGNILDVATPGGQQYCFDIIKKSGQPTLLCGSEYKTFIAQFGMRAGYKIAFNMQGSPDTIPIWPEGANGEPLAGIIPFQFHLGCFHSVFFSILVLWLSFSSGPSLFFVV